VPETTFRFNGCRFSVADGRLRDAENGASLTLRPQAARLLVAFLERPGQVLDREHLRKAVWDERAVVDFESGLAALMRELRQALADVGLGAELIETVPRRGYRFLGAVEAEPLEETDRVPGDSADPRRALPARPTLLTLALLAIVLIAALSWWVVAEHGTEPSVRANDKPTLAIIPFEAYSDNGQDDRRLRLLLADRLLAQLWQVELTDLDLIGRAALRPYQDREDQASAVAADLGVSLLLEGSIIRSGENGWQVDARLLAMPRGTVMWSSSVRWEDQPELPVMPTANHLVADLAEAWPVIRVDLAALSE
jgi:DNA-binding winged helix-turn-helix (wHTH) protein/TolB-like protein